MISYAFFRWRPRMWAWPVIAFGILWPPTQNAILQGNTNLWVAAGVAGGLLWGWPAVLIILKPTFAPLVIIGFGRRSWWLAWALMAGLAVVMWSMWLDYVTIIQNTTIPWTYSLGGLPSVAIVVAAYIGRSTGAGLSADGSLGRWIRR